MNPCGNSVEQNWNSFKQAVTTGISQFIPQKSSKLKFSLPWITPKIKREMHKKDRLHRRAVRTKDQHHWKAFKRQRNSMSNLIKESHNSYLNDVIGDSLTENPKRFWSYVKHSRSENLGIPPLKTEQGMFVTDKDKAETLNSSFFLFSRMNNYLYLKFLYLLTLRLLTYIHHPKELLNNYPSSILTMHVVLTNCLHMY